MDRPRLIHSEPLPDKLTVNIRRCARCGYNHEGVEFKRFHIPIMDGYDKQWHYWGTCPTNGDPILLNRQDDYEAS